MLESVALEQETKEEKYNSEWLKSFEGFEEYSKEEAEKELDSLKQLAQIVCQHLINTS
ncbi:hypothetical protein [Tenacibaculum aquimarinum]|uniref:hypothetical protein n=1 Tax=Tenacibaculum aquimarinum TaxID=2910675 RepID=UPI001F0A760C|nr:hypothetical protein [Tenacibaculum aquimarinum]MCH3884572.1 hypothetical protein [Tenacibaculum aquimarinum]